MFVAALAIIHTTVRNDPFMARTINIPPISNILNKFNSSINNVHAILKQRSHVNVRNKKMLDREIIYLIRINQMWNRKYSCKGKPTVYFKHSLRFKSQSKWPWRKVFIVSKTFIQCFKSKRNILFDLNISFNWLKEKHLSWKLQRNHNSSRRTYMTKEKHYGNAKYEIMTSFPAAATVPCRGIVTIEFSFGFPHP